MSFPERLQRASGKNQVRDLTGKLKELNLDVEFRQLRSAGISSQTKTKVKGIIKAMRFRDRHR